MSSENKEPMISKMKLYDEIGVPFTGQVTGMDRLRSSYIEQQKKLKKKNEQIQDSDMGRNQRIR